MNLNNLRILIQTIPQQAQDFSFSVQQDQENGRRMGIPHSGDSDSTTWTIVGFVIGAGALIWLWKFLSKK
jgi:LPXTG-motif cell wall-anchored protein